MKIQCGLQTNPNPGYKHTSCDGNDDFCLRYFKMERFLTCDRNNDFCSRYCKMERIRTRVAKQMAKNRFAGSN